MHLLGLPALRNKTNHVIGALSRKQPAGWAVWVSQSCVLGDLIAVCQLLTE
jgi:hypothetical protein